MKRGTDRTGGVFKAICSYIEDVCKPGTFKSFFGENVVGLMDLLGQRYSNLDYCQFQLSNLQNGMAQALVVFKLTPVLFGFPAQRWRLWMFTIPYHLLERAGTQITNNKVISF